MARSNSRLSYQDCFQLLDKALANEKGSRIKVADRAAAVHLRSRLHYARSLDRLDNEETYPEGHLMHGKSPYDPLVCKIRKDKTHHWVYVLKSDQVFYHTEEIGEDDGIIQGSPSDNGETDREEEGKAAKAPEEEERRA